jgi:PAS domain S-box-containing protein
MRDEVRKSGIGVIGDVPWGTHFCQFYQTKIDLIETLVPYFKAGLKNNEFCMWVTADNLTTQEARKAMTKAMPDFSGYLKKGQIEILSYNEWYLEGGFFNSQNVLDGWVEKLNQALGKGYDGLRLTGNTFWLEKKDWHSFSEYEAAVNNVISKYKMIALCTYCLDKCNAAEIVDVIRNHEFALIKQEGKWVIFENSQHKTIKEALKESDINLKTIAESVPTGIGVVGIPDGKFLYVNSAYENAFGYAYGELIGQITPEIYWDVEDRTKILKLLKKNKQVVDYNVRLKKKDGTMFWGMASVRPITFKGNSALLGTFTDITERKNVENDVIRLGRELQAIRECNQAIVHANDEKSLLSDVCRILFTTAGYPLAWVGSVKHDKFKSVQPLAWSGDEEYIAKANITWADNERGRGPTGLAIRTGKTHFFQDFITEPAAAPWRASALLHGYRSSIAIPLKDEGGNVFAVLSLYSSEINSFNPTEVKLLEELARDLSFGISVITERAKRQQAEAEVFHLASFPAMNPMQVIEVDTSGTVQYCNESTKKLFPDLAKKGIQHPYVVGLLELVNKHSLVKAKTFIREVEIAGKYYEQLIYIVGDGQHIRIYGHDVSENHQADELLRETSNYLNNLLDYANAPIIVWDPHFRISRFNPAFERLTGYKAGDVMGEQLSLLFLPDRKEESLQQIQRTLAGERWEIVEIPIMRVDGEVRIVLWNSANVYDNDGRTIIATIAQGQDITERKQAEEKLKTSEIQYRRLFEAAKDGILILDGDTGKILDVNPFLTEMLGLTYKEFIGKHLWELGYFRDIVANKDKFSELQARKYIRYEDLPLRASDGREMKVEFVSNPYNVDHRTIIQCNIRDITERKQTEEKLQETTEYLNNLLDYANAPIIVWDPLFHITRFNHAFERLTGLSDEQAIGKKLDILFPEDSKAQSMNYIKKAMSGEHWEVVEIPILRRDGVVRIVLWNSATLLGIDGKKMVATIAQGQDITERKQAEEEVKKLNDELKHRATELEVTNKELEAFSYSVSHDLRAPLRTMEGFSQALLEDCSDILNDQCKDYLRRIQGSAELMAQLIDDMLQLSRLTRVDMLFNKVNLSELAQTIASELKTIQPKRKAVFDITPRLIVNGDGKLLRVVLYNLLENAWKFTGKVPEAHIEFGVTNHEGKKVYYIRDNGAGFDMTYIAKIFNPFQRLHTASEFPGTGIGLASVQRIIHRHGGKVWAEGKVGKGATFYFTLNE